MAAMNIEYVPLTDIKPYEKNAKKHPEKQVEYIANSIKEFGWKQPLVVDENGEIIIGHGRYFAAKKLKLDAVPCIYARDLSEQQIKALRLADNKTNESEWDLGLLDIELGDIFDLDMSDFGFDDEPDGIGGGKYEGKIVTPIYEIKGDMPKVYELVDTAKTTELIAEIEDADIDDDIKDFLRYAAYRHLSFRYDKVAEFYAWQPPEVQKLMEDSGLVIIDVNAAIENGFVKLTERLQELIDNEE